MKLPTQVSIVEYYKKYMDITSHIHSEKNDFTLAEFTNEEFQVKHNFIELFDGILLDIGLYSGNFSNIMEKCRQNYIVFGFIQDGYFEDINNGLLLKKNEIYCFDSCHYDMSGKKIAKCKCIQISIDIQSAKREINKYLKNFSLEYFFEKLQTKSLHTQAIHTQKYVFNQICMMKNIDLLRLKVLESLLIIDSALNTLQIGNTHYIKQIAQFIYEECHQELTIKILSDMVGVSKSKLMQDFRNIYQTSIYQYIKQSRMQKASLLLQHSSKTISEIANVLGYINVSAFCKNFKEYYGYSPNIAKNNYRSFLYIETSK